MTKLLTTFTALAVLIFTNPAEARGPERYFGGKILTSKKAFPRSAKSLKAYVKQLRKLDKLRIWENEEKKEYKVYFAAFFKRPHRALEITVRIYDISTGRRKLLLSFQQYLAKKGQQSYISSTTLAREDVGVNKQLMMVLEHRGKTLAKGKFKVLGKKEKYKGKVDFSESET